jgi:hypothetical protein
MVFGIARSQEQEGREMFSTFLEKDGCGFKVFLQNRVFSPKKMKSRSLDNVLCGASQGCVGQPEHATGCTSTALQRFSIEPVVHAQASESFHTYD